jgi:hypothetical protein
MNALMTIPMEVVEVDPPSTICDGMSDYEYGMVVGRIEVKLDLMKKQISEFLGRIDPKWKEGLL